MVSIIIKWMQTNKGKHRKTTNCAVQITLLDDLIDVRDPNTSLLVPHPSSRVCYK
jgi:hypothetical protein